MSTILRIALKNAVTLSLVLTGAFAVPSLASAQSGPTVVSSSPANLATGVSPTSPVIITFSTAMNTNLTIAQFYDTMAPTSPLPVTATWSADETILTCSPNFAFPAGATIFWSVVGEDLNGAQLQGAGGIFTTSSGGASTAPTILSIVPGNLASNVPPSAPVVFTFSAVMDANATVARFMASSAPTTPLPVNATWNLGLTTLTSSPAPAFPANALILWSVGGEDVLGNALPATSGSFWTAGPSGGQTNSAGFGLVSRGELVEQVDTNVLENTLIEFVALAAYNPGNSVTVTAPPPGRTNTLENAGAPGALEFSDTDTDSSSFGTNYPPGAYTFTLATAAGVSTASLDLEDGALPSAPQVTSWQDPPYVELGQPWSVSWDFAAGGAAVDYVRLCIEESGTIIFATPLPVAAGALTGASNSVVVPASVFTNAGLAEVSLTAFSFTGLDTNAIPGTTLRTARHCTTTFELRVVDGSVPPPILLTTNMGGVPVGEAFLNPLFTTNGAQPLHFDVIGGALPPGLMVETAGAISGQASSEGTFDAALRLTDLLGRSSTQSLRVVTVPLPPASAPPQLENARLGAGAALLFDVVGAAGTNCVIERSTDMSNWTAFLTTNVAGDQLTLRVPIDSGAAFFRARSPGSGLPFPPPNPLTVTPVLNTNVAVSALLDEIGGTLSLTNGGGYVFALNVPVGALDRAETITMTDVAQIGGLPLSGGLAAAVNLEPEGLPFNVVSRLDITAPADINAATIIGFGARPDGSQFALQPAFNTNRTVSLYLWHFSLAGAGNGTAADAQAQAQNSPDDPMAALAQQVVAALQACKADPSCAGDLSSISGQLTDSFIQMADQVILPKLQAAVADDSVLDDAMQTWLGWLKDIELLGLYDGGLFGDDQSGALAQRVRRAGSLAAQAIRNGINNACDQCMQHQLSQLGRMLELTHDAGLLGLDYQEAFWSCARKCLVFELEIESEIVSADGGVMSTHTKGKAKLRPQTLGDTDPVTVDMVRLMLIFSGSGSWDITDLQTPVPPKCTLQVAPASGRLSFPWVKIDLYRKRQVWVPGQGPVTGSVFDPDMTVKLRSDLSFMPKEGRTYICPPASPAAVPDFFGPFFNALHNQEVSTPTGLYLEITGGPVFNMTGFVPGGPEDIILSKVYFQTAGSTTENTLIQLRHTPQ
jgi:hypothetical protein